MAKTPTYLKTHPWLSFQVNLKDAPATTWIDLGEIRSKCIHLSGVPLMPETAKRLHNIYLAKGIHATTAIEGNTLSEAQVQDIIEKKIDVPQSQKYLQVEVDNILEISNDILTQVEGFGFSPIKLEGINRYNELVLKDLEVEQHVVPGEFRKCSVGVLHYKAPPFEECDMLMEQYVAWLNSDTFKVKDDESAVINGVIKAILAHLYLAWIHPFGDGNGRTARVLEVRFLLEAGLPSAAAHLLSNHYNLTRTEYYRQLDRASKSGGDVLPFINYAVVGLRDQMREQLKTVKYQQWHVAWTNYVHSKFKGKDSAKDTRQLKLALALSEKDVWVDRVDLKNLNPEVAVKYAQVDNRTLLRDLKELIEMSLISEDKNRYKASKETILAFLPRLRKGEVDKQLEEAMALVEDIGQLNFGF